MFDLDDGLLGEFLGLVNPAGVDDEFDWSLRMAHRNSYLGMSFCCWVR